MKPPSEDLKNWDPTGIIDYGSLIYITLQRATSARDAISMINELVEYGYYSSGESFSIADKDEVWIMELIGKGPGKKGACGLRESFLTVMFQDMPTRHVLLHSHWLMEKLRSQSKKSIKFSTPSVECVYA